MDPDKMRHRFTILASTGPEDSRDQYGEPALAQAVLCETWAQVRPLTGKQLESARQVYAEVTHEVTLRWRPGVEAGQTGVLNGRLYHLDAVMDLEERHEWLQLLCTEKQGAPYHPR